MIFRELPVTGVGIETLAVVVNEIPKHPVVVDAGTVNVPPDAVST